MMMSFVDVRVTFVLRILIGLFGKRTCVATNQIPFPVSHYQSMNLTRAYLRKELKLYRLWVREDAISRMNYKCIIESSRDYLPFNS
jgi:hypothetical protein